MKFQTVSISLLPPASKPWESWKIKSLPGYVIWCSILWMPLWNGQLHINGWSISYTMQLTSSEGFKCGDKEGNNGILSSFFICLGSLILELEPFIFTPCSSYMMVLVPWATWQTFSRMVVLPALALPMTSIRKWGHAYRPWSRAIDSGSAECHIWKGTENGLWPTWCMCSSMSEGLCHH